MNLQDLQRDPSAFRSALLIDSDSGPVPFASVMDPWQRADFEALDPGWKATVTQSNDDAICRAWLERGRGSSKTTDLSVMSAWALFASKRRLTGIAAAADLDQSKLLRDGISKLVYLNPWLQPIIEVQASRAINVHTESCLDFIASDAPSAYGLTPDFLILDEVTHWKKRDMWDALISAAAKRSRCMVTCITNAGIQDDWQWEVREAIRISPTWHFHRLEGHCASWISQALLDEQRRLLPPMAFSRLWDNSWVSGGGDFLSPELIDEAFKDNLEPIPAAQPGWTHCSGVDLAVSRDSACVCVLGIKRGNRRDSTGHGRIRLCHIDVWKPTKTQKIDLQSIEDRLIVLHQRYKFKSVAFDPWEARHMSQRLALAGLPCNELVQQGNNLQRIASCIIESFNDRRVDLYPHAGLHQDLIKCRVEPRNYGFRIVSPRDASGHGDCLSAFSYACLSVTDAAEHAPVIVGGRTFSPGISAFERAQRRFEKQAAFEARIAAGPSEDQGELPQLLSAMRDPRFRF